MLNTGSKTEVETFQILSNQSPNMCASNFGRFKNWDNPSDIDPSRSKYGRSGYLDDSCVDAYLKVLYKNSQKIISQFSILEKFSFGLLNPRLGKQYDIEFARKHFPPIIAFPKDTNRLISNEHITFSLN